MDPSELRQMSVHVSLLNEFNKMKEELEAKTGYAIKGGNPVISQIVANILKERRECRPKKDCFEIKKVKGEKKKEILWL